MISENLYAFLFLFQGLVRKKIELMKSAVAEDKKFHLSQILPPLP